MVDASALLTRREALYRMLFGSSMLGLSALATGIPLSILAHPRRALAGAPPACGSEAQYLIMSTSGLGDPVNGNVPGTYEDARIVHPPDPAMAATPMTLAGVATTAAKPWAMLPQPVLDRTAFFHHGTYTVVHGDERISMELHGAVAKHDMLVSSLATQLAPCLQTVQIAPIALGGTVVYAQGRPQPTLGPSSLASILAAPQGPLANLQDVRDAHLDQLSAYFRAQGTNAQKAFIDNYAISREQARSIGQSLLSTLSGIKDNSVASQITAAVTLIQMNVAPVIVIGIPFGGDNHVDTDLSAETLQTVAAVQHIADLMQLLASHGLSDRVSFLQMNVFGRTMAAAHKGTTGRDHLGTHHCSVMIGKGLRGSVVGGVVPMGSDYGAQAIDAGTGAGVSSGDIPFDETFAAVGKTLGAAVGVDRAYLEANIEGGQVVTGALA